MDWVPQVGRMDVGAVKGAAFTAFDTEVLQPDGTHKRVTIDSFHKLRQVERESEQRARDGEGQQMIWRDLSQDRSNHDVHTMGPDPAQVAQADLAKARAEVRSRAQITHHRAHVEPTVTLGPGVDESSVSPLGVTE